MATIYSTPHGAQGLNHAYAPSLTIEMSLNCLGLLETPALLLDFSAHSAPGVIHLSVVLGEWVPLQGIASNRIVASH